MSDTHTAARDSHSVLAETHGSHPNHNVMAGSAALAVLLLAALLTALTGGGSSNAGGPPKLALLAGGAGLESRDAAMSSSMKVAPVTYTVDGTLPELPASAPAYSVAASGSRDDLVRVAKVLGVNGKVVTDEGGLAVRDGDLVVRLQQYPGQPWYLSNEPKVVPCPSAAPGKPAAPDAPASKEGAVSSDGVVSSTGPMSCVDTGTVGSASGGGAAGSSGSVEPTGPAEPAPGQAADGGQQLPNDPNVPSDPNAASPPSPAPSPDEQAKIDCKMPVCPDGVACAQVCPGTPPDMAEPQRPADIPSKADAEATAKRLAGEIGVDVTKATVTVNDGFDVWDVAIDPMVGGLRTVGLTTSIGIGPKGKVVRASGFLASPELLGDYDLVGAEAGLERLKTGWPYNTGGPQTLEATSGAAAKDATDSPGNDAATDMTMIAPELACDPAPCPEPEPFVRHITGVALGLQFSSISADQPGYLVPSYLFRFDDGGEAPVIGVTDALLAPAPAVDTGVEPAKGGPAPDRPVTGGASTGGAPG